MSIFLRRLSGRMSVQSPLISAVLPAAVRPRLFLYAEPEAVPRKNRRLPAHSGIAIYTHETVEKL